MNLQWVVNGSMAAAAPEPEPGSVALGLGIFGVILVLAILVAFLWGKTSALRRAASRCPKCGTVGRGGKFCPTCGSGV